MDLERVVYLGEPSFLIRGVQLVMICQFMILNSMFPNWMMTLNSMFPNWRMI